MKKIFKFSDYNSINESDNDNLSEVESKIINNSNLDFKFIDNVSDYKTFHTLIKSILLNKNINDVDSVIYLSLCSLAIIFEEPKDSYKKIFEELRLRGIYGYLKPIVNIFKEIFKIFNKIDEVDNYLKMFKSGLFKPFMKSLNDVLVKNDSQIDKINIDADFEKEILKKLKNSNLEDIYSSKIKVNIEKKTDGDIKKYSEFKKDVEILHDNKSN